MDKKKDWLRKKGPGFEETCMYKDSKKVHFRRRKMEEKKTVISMRIFMGRELGP